MDDWVPVPQVTPDSGQIARMTQEEAEDTATRLRGTGMSVEIVYLPLTNDWTVRIVR